MSARRQEATDEYAGPVRARRRGAARPLAAPAAALLAAALLLAGCTGGSDDADARAASQQHRVRPGRPELRCLRPDDEVSAYQSVVDA